MNMAHVHLWLTHFPILGSIFLTVLFLVALIYRNGFLQKVSLWFLGGVALVTIPTFFSGEAAEESVEHLPGVSEALISQHEFVSRFGLGVMCVSGIMALVGVVLFRRRPTLPRTLVATMLVLLLVNVALFAFIGLLGGQIRHPEIRTHARVLLIDHEQRAHLHAD